MTHLRDFCTARVLKSTPQNLVWLKIRQLDYGTVSKPYFASERNEMPLWVTLVLSPRQRTQPALYVATKASPPPSLFHIWCELPPSSTSSSPISRACVTPPPLRPFLHPLVTRLANPLTYLNCLPPILEENRRRTLKWRIPQTLSHIFCSAFPPFSFFPGRMDQGEGGERAVTRRAVARPFLKEYCRYSHNPTS